MSTLGASRRRSIGGGDGGTAADGPAAQVLREQVASLQTDLERRQAAYIRREREYRSRIELLEREVQRAKGSKPADEEVETHRHKLRGLHCKLCKMSTEFEQ